MALSRSSESTTAAFSAVLDEAWEVAGLREAAKRGAALGGLPATEPCLPRIVLECERIFGVYIAVGCSSAAVLSLRGERESDERDRAGGDDDIVLSGLYSNAGDCLG